MVVVVVVLSFLDGAPCRYRRSTGVQYQMQWHVRGTNRRREGRHVNGTRPQRHVIISRESPLSLLYCLRVSVLLWVHLGIVVLCVLYRLRGECFCAVYVLCFCSVYMPKAYVALTFESSLLIS